MLRGRNVAARPRHAVGVVGERMNRTIAISAPELPLFEARLASRLSIGFMLDICDLGRHAAPLLDMLLANAIIAANVAHILGDPALQTAYARIDTPPPDELRRGVSINALAESLRLPFETVRRHVRQLVARGACVVQPQGLYVPKAIIDSAPFLAMQQVRYDRLVRFCHDLRAVKAIDPPPFDLPPAGDPQAPVRGIGRLLSEYFFRNLEAMHDLARDPLNALVLLQVIHSSSEHLGPAELEEALRAGGIPDEARRPVRAIEISRRLNVPYETTRRHIGWLVEDGRFRRVGAGVVVDQAFMEAPPMAMLRAENLTSIRRMCRGVAALAAEPARAAARASD